MYQVLEVGGPVLAYGTVGLTALYALFSGVTPFLPEMVAGAAALRYMRRTARG